MKSSFVKIMAEGTPVFHTRARGKLLLSGEYAVLDGALALAVPVRFGQELGVYAVDRYAELHWKAFDERGQLWLEAVFSLPDLNLLSATDQAAAERLRQVLAACRKQNTDFLRETVALEVCTRTDFPRNWGLGTSSTLIASVARWAGSDPYRLLADTFGGSGYDIACAYASGPITFRLAAGRPEVREAPFEPPFLARLYFVYLGQKQDSREGIRRYRQIATGKDKLADEISALTGEMLRCPRQDDFDALLERHEALLSAALQLPKVKALHFPDFEGQVKSLGAWGGDFVLASSGLSETETRAYFEGKGFAVCLGWQEMVG